MAKLKSIGAKKYVIVTPDGDEVILNYDAVFQYKNDIAIFRIVNEKGVRQYGYLDKYGKKLSDKVYDHADNFDGKYAKVKNGDLQNYINKHGVEILSWKYTHIERFIKNSFIISINEKDNETLWAVIDINEELITPLCTSKQKAIIDAKKIILGS